MGDHLRHGRHLSVTATQERAAALPGPGEAICSLDALPEGEARPFLVRNPSGRTCEIVLLRRGTGVVAYENSCPHTGMTLDGGSAEFMALDGTHLLCLMHGAEFQPEDGLCIAGPCLGDRLRPVPVRIAAGRVILLPPSAG